MAIIYPKNRPDVKSSENIRTQTWSWLHRPQQSRRCVCPPCPPCPLVNSVQKTSAQPRVVQKISTSFAQPRVVQKTSAQHRIVCKKVVNKKTGRYEMWCKPDVSITNAAKPAQKPMIRKRVMDKTKKKGDYPVWAIGSF